MARKPPIKLQPGQRVGAWTVLHRDPNPKDTRTSFWVCECECGTVSSIKTCSLTLALRGNGGSSSCGCQQAERRLAKLRPRWEAGERGFRYKHGGVGTDEYRIWYQMVQRCHNPKNKAYRHYGSRGIEVCEEWRSLDGGFEQFRKDMGPRPSKKHSVDRVDNDGPYSPSNCRWATAAVQAANRRKYVWVEKSKFEKMEALLEELGVSIDA